jgi:hypothetical protein
MENVNQNEYREDLLNWCHNIYLHWENMKPRFLKTFDVKSIDEWDESYRKLINKLETNVEVNMVDYLEATSLYEQWEILCTESNCNPEKNESKKETLNQSP